mmetsp:Transcript_60989/g.176567  ORF Transcript_60989/g.176567 Transcript_60989/m.176567 type:complete len:263 (-) Transcript_60989:1036-1824(-)
MCSLSSRSSASSPTGRHTSQGVLTPAARHYHRRRFRRSRTTPCSFACSQTSARPAGGRSLRPVKGRHSRRRRGGSNQAESRHKTHSSHTPKARRSCKRPKCASSSCSETNTSGTKCSSGSNSRLRSNHGMERSHGPRLVKPTTLRIQRMTEGILSAARREFARGPRPPSPVVRGQHMSFLSAPPLAKEAAHAPCILAALAGTLPARPARLADRQAHLGARARRCMLLVVVKWAAPMAWFGLAGRRHCASVHRHSLRRSGHRL